MKGEGEEGEGEKKGEGEEEVNHIHPQVVKTFYVNIYTRLLAKPELIPNKSS